MFRRFFLTQHAQFTTRRQPLHAIRVLSRQHATRMNCRHRSRRHASCTAFLGCSAASAPALLLISQCDAPRHDEDEDDNPLWPSGVSHDMVNRYVDQILADPAINMRSIPDSMERVIYVSTVRVTLNAVYETVSTLHGTELLGHRMVLSRSTLQDDIVALDFQHNSGKIDVSVLQALADELLKSKAINQRWLPDRIEKQIYTNCLRIVFQILDKIADTVSFRMCGHELSLSFEPVSEEKAQELAKRQQSKQLSDHREIDAMVLHTLVEETIRESQRASSIGAAVSYLPFYESFLRALHRTLYSLILGIVDDILQKTEIIILGEIVRINLVPERVYQSRRGQLTLENDTD